MIIDHRCLNSFYFIFIFLFIFPSLFLSVTSNESIFHNHNNAVIIRPLRIIHNRKMENHNNRYMKRKRYSDLDEFHNNLVESDNYHHSSYDRKSTTANQSAPPLDIPNLINRFQLSSMKWLLSMPNNGQQQVDPNVLRKRIMSTRWSRIKNGQPFVLLDNQMVPADSVTNALINSNLSNDDNQPSKQMIDSKLIDIINKNGQNKKNLLRKLHKHRNDDIYHAHQYNDFNNIEKNRIDHEQFPSTNSVRNFAPDFKRFPNNSRRFRLSTLGQIGYNQ